MKYFLISLFIVVCSSLSAQEHSWRSSKNNEITLLYYSMWNNNFLSYGIGYERNIYTYKNKLNSYLSWKNVFFVRSDNFFENFPSFSPTTNQAQSFIKYNLGFKKILSVGAGLIMEGKRFYINPTGLIAYKFAIPKLRMTVGMQYQVSLYRSIPLSKLNGVPLPGSITGITNHPFNIIENWCGGLFVGKYF
jgi:hypothetical protein